MGVASADCRKVGELIGVKVFLNEFVAYSELGKLINNTRTLAAYNGSWQRRYDDILLAETNVTLVGGVLQVGGTAARRAAGRGRAMGATAGGDTADNSSKMLVTPQRPTQIHRNHNPGINHNPKHDALFIFETIIVYVYYLNSCACAVWQERTVAIATYALCGFANISSIGMVMGSLGSMAGHRKPEVAAYAVRAMIVGNVVCFLNACTAGELFLVIRDVVTIFQ